MKILSIDTSSATCSIAVLDNQNLLHMSNIESENSHSNNILSVIDNVLKCCNLTISNIELITVNIGPRFIYRN